MEKRTARMTILIDPKKKAVFEQLCDAEDMNSSQKIRQFIREYLEDKLGPEWRDKVFGKEESS